MQTVIAPQEKATSPLAPAVASSSRLTGLNCNALIAPLCFVVRETNGLLVLSHRVLTTCKPLKQSWPYLSPSNSF